LKREQKNFFFFEKKILKMAGEQRRFDIFNGEEGQVWRGRILLGLKIRKLAHGLENCPKEEEFFLSINSETDAA
jgi:hypothetical protein